MAINFSHMEELPFCFNVSFLSVFVSWVLAQSIKFFSHLAKHKEVEFYFFVSTGGMPSAHSASVSALATAIGLLEGFQNPLFALALTFAFIVMFDAQSVRRAAGNQARTLNQIVEELFKGRHWPHGKLGEFLGHTRLEVLAGMGLGIVVAILLVNYC